jgi:glycerol-3-phosphate acyltransferase PlsY
VIGVFAAMDLRLLLPLLLSWIIVLLLSGYVGLATMLSTVVLAVAVVVVQPGNIPLCTFCAAVAVFVIFTHRSNIARMRAGKENRVQRLWLFRPRTV